MGFLETPIFTKLVSRLISDEQYHVLQLHLAIRPESGDVIKGSGGISEVAMARVGAWEKRRYPNYLLFFLRKMIRFICYMPIRKIKKTISQQIN